MYIWIVTVLYTDSHSNLIVLREQIFLFQRKKSAKKKKKAKVKKW